MMNIVKASVINITATSVVEVRDIRLLLLALADDHAVTFRSGYASCGHSKVVAGPHVTSHNCGRCEVVPKCGIPTD